MPNGTLFGDGVCARIKEELLKEFNLHTIVRLPNGVFAPYTSIPTNLLFFDRSGPTKDIWYYELPLPEGRKNYTKTKPIQFEEFADLISWWPEHSRQDNDSAWHVDVKDVFNYDEAGRLQSVNLDVRNPASTEDLQHLPPEQLIGQIEASHGETASALEAFANVPNLQLTIPEVVQRAARDLAAREHVPVVCATAILFELRSRTAPSTSVASVLECPSRRRVGRPSRCAQRLPGDQKHRDARNHCGSFDCRMEAIVTIAGS